MRTITTYKVVFVDDYGDINEIDFNNEHEARNFAATISNTIIYKVQMLGSIERI